MALLMEPGFVLSRVRQGDRLEVALPETRLSEGDLVVAVGNAESLVRARVLFGEECTEHLPAPQAAGITYRRIFVSSHEVVGRTVAQIQLERFHATITRLRRGDADFVPSPDTVLELGDRVRVVAPAEDLERVSKYFGDSIRALSETDFLSLSLGIVLGVLLGMIPLPLPNGMTFRLGFAGGPLIMALIVGRLERTGPVTWGLPFEANLVLRQLGLVFFLAGVGTRAGQGFAGTFADGGALAIAVGAAITTVVAVGGILAGYRFLKLPMSAVMGMVSAMHTQPACLAFATQHSGNDMPNEWYASVYPASMIAKILLAQVLVTVLLSSGRRRGRPRPVRLTAPSRGSRRPRRGLAGDAAREVREQEEPGGADLLARDVAPQGPARRGAAACRRSRGCRARPACSPGRPRWRSRGCPSAQLPGQLAHALLEHRLGAAHDVVVGHARSAAR